MQRLRHGLVQWHTLVGKSNVAIEGYIVIC